MPTFLYARVSQDPVEEKKIRQLAGAHHAPAGWILRAQIITASWRGQRVPRIATDLHCHPKTVRLWLHRFNTDGLDGLADRPIPGRPRRISEAERSQLIALARSTPPGRLARTPGGELVAEDEAGAPQWTLDSLAETARQAGIEVGRSQVRRILRAERVRWRRTRSWTTSSDPEVVPQGRQSSSSTPIHRRTARWSVRTSSAR
ncbi:helix-turn-helix domain-containing protein [Protofrankia symbiont of Coriaria ruscifolia]|uniref:helix-turn-helix domain-containing protein n=1 Tax=Protofrankia symbiont of Coriaria ruscifolia TaxID=1306542 RepID=UPI00104196F7|nr:helix-turn-helix domain-containing protein [Protofrankia symbiont of Coriaria ruscifolia]